MVKAMAVISVLTAVTVLAAFWKAAYEAEMEEFRRTMMELADRNYERMAAYPPVECFDRDAEFRRAVIEWTRILRNRCACRTCNNARQRAMMEKR